MEHWIEPQALGNCQRTGYNSPLAEMDQAGVQHYVSQEQSPCAGSEGSMAHYVNRPGQLAGDHYVNRPGQLSGIMDTVKTAVPHVLIGVALGYFALPWAIKKAKKIKKGL